MFAVLSTIVPENRGWTMRCPVIQAARRDELVEAAGRFRDSLRRGRLTTQDQDAAIAL